MTATATAMVKAIWQSYFNVPDPKAAAAAAEGAEAAPAEEAPAKVGCLWLAGLPACLPWHSSHCASRPMKGELITL